ncbi:hypothetical protein [Desulfotomaculum sp. 1211_IL3151]|uniref:hypothetical protein n=1 Tax=Desulfotomaculum sp. 1211_IL3151 TaxID=3084055 RepID=UPI002FD9B9FF
MDKFVVLKKDEKGQVVEATIPLPKDYIEELVPPFPIDNDMVIEPFAEKVKEEKDNAPILG